MTARMDYQEIAPDSTKGLTEIARWVRAGTLDPGLIELVKLRASQMNGCAYCLEIHMRRARKFRVSEERLDTLAGWYDSTAFSEPERAALAWTEALTMVADGHVPDAAWEAVHARFTDREVVELSMAIVEINAWNRLQVAFRRPPEFEARPRPAPAAPPS